MNFDGITRAFEINYVVDPSFERFNGVINYDKESPITIKVSVDKITCTDQHKKNKDEFLNCILFIK